MSYADKKKRKLSDYKYFLEYRTRWLDNDMYQHMNNSVYNMLFDSIINDYLIKYCGRDPATSEENGIVVTSHADFFGSVHYPDVLSLGMRVNKLGKTSVEYEVGVFQKGHDDVRAVGGFTHVFTDRKSNRPMPNGMSPHIRKAFEKIMVDSEPKGRL